MRVILLLMLLYPNLSHAEGVKVIYMGMEEVEDCEEKSEWVEVVDKETGVVRHVVVSPCSQGKEN